MFSLLQILRQSFLYCDFVSFFPASSIFFILFYHLLHHFALIRRERGSIESKTKKNGCWEKHGDFESTREKKRLGKERENTPKKSGAKKTPEWERESECERKWIFFWYL
jgi:hypothetical protein